MCLAVPGKLISMDDSPPLMRTGKVNFGGILKEVNLAFVPDVRVGDYVLVHVGFALSIVDEAEAKQVFGYLQKIDQLAELKELSDV